MPSAERFRRFALIAIISLVIGASTLANLLKQTTPPEDALARAAVAGERPSSPIPAPRADVVSPPANAAKPEVPAQATPAPVTTAAAPAPSSPAPPPSIAEPPAPAAPPIAQAGEFPPMQPMTDDAAKPGAAAAAVTARPQRADTEPQRRAEKPAAEKPASEKPEVKRTADGQSTKRKSVRPAPYSMRDFLASHR
jgi:hypothetical protein